MADRNEIVGSFEAEDGAGGRYTIHVVETVDETEAGDVAMGIGRERMMLGLREVEEVGGRLRIKDSGTALWRV